MTAVSVVERHCDHELAAVIDRMADLLDDRLVFVLFLLHEKFVKAEESKWKSYLAVFPARARSPLFFDAETELERISCTPLYNAVQAKRSALQREFESLQALLEDNDAQGSPFIDASGKNHFTLENFLWADTMVRSREFGIPSSLAEKGKVDGMILLLDSLNHSQQPSGHWRIGESEQEGITPEEAKFIYLRTSPANQPT